MSTDPTTRLNAALEGRYRIERRLGEGGMATVYLARDEKHNRPVALKVLKPELAAVIGAERFLAEIETTANLQHPHILPLHDSGEADGLLFYVMPYIEGESLRERLDRQRQLGVDEAVTITTKVAAALQAAHERGVIHRDIKPANILLSKGEPLISDFGIALAVTQGGAGRLTETGLSLGTPHYMSPEQATGDQNVGAATDLYALGCVLYEMLVGEPPYTGSTPQAILGKIIQAEPVSATKTRRTVPAHVDAVIRRSLEKVPADRFRAASELVAALGDPGFRHVHASETAGATSGPAASAGPWNQLSVALACTVLLLAALAGWGWLRPAPPLMTAGASTVLRMDLSGFRLTSPEGGGERLAISPDGARIALTSESDGGTKLYLRDAADVTVREIPGTAGSSQATFSPDGEWLAFGTADGWVSRVSLSGGPVLPVAEGLNPHWGLDGSIVFTRDGGIYLIAPSGREPRLVWESEDLDAVTARPHLLPNGRAIVFQGAEPIERRRLLLLEVESGEVKDLGVTGNNPVYVPTGHLLYGHHDQAVMAVPFDVDALEVTGAPTTVLSDVVVYSGGATQFAVSENGTALVGVRDSGAQDRDLVLVGLDGSETRLPLTGAFTHPRFSPPDGKRIAYESGRQIWMYDLVTGANDRLTSGGNYRSPWWSRDGRYLYFSGFARLSTSYDGFRRRADGSEEQEVLYRRDGDDEPAALSSDGGSLLVEVQTLERGQDLLIMTSTEGGPVWSDYLRGNWHETSAALSPDGAWLAYASDQTGALQIYVRSFPEADRAQVVSTDGGTQPVWAPDGSTIYYRNGGRVMRARVRTADVISVDPPQLLFESDWLVDAVGRHDWDIHPDGASFVAVRGPATGEGEVDGVPVIPLQVIVNFFEELKRLTVN